MAAPLTWKLNRVFRKTILYEFPNSNSDRKLVLYSIQFPPVILYDSNVDHSGVTWALPL